MSDYENRVNAHKGQLFQLQRAILRSPTLSHGAVRLALMLLDYGPTSFPLQSTLARDLHVSERAVRKYLSELQAQGIVRVTGRGRSQSNEYTINASIADRNNPSGEEQSFRSERNNRSGQGGTIVPVRPEQSFRQNGPLNDPMNGQPNAPALAREAPAAADHDGQGEAPAPSAPAPTGDLIDALYEAGGYDVFPGEGREQVERDIKRIRQNVEVRKPERLIRKMIADEPDPKRLRAWISEQGGGERTHNRKQIKPAADAPKPNTGPGYDTPPDAVRPSRRGGRHPDNTGPGYEVPPDVVEGRPGYDTPPHVVRPPRRDDRQARWRDEGDAEGLEPVDCDDTDIPF